MILVLCSGQRSRNETSYVVDVSEIISTSILFTALKNSTIKLNKSCANYIWHTVLFWNSNKVKIYDCFSMKILPELLAIIIMSTVLQNE